MLIVDSKQFHSDLHPIGDKSAGQDNSREQLLKVFLFD